MIRKRYWPLAIPVAAGLWLATAVILPPLLHARVLAHVRSIPIGATRQEVERVVGAPTERYPKGAKFVDAIAKSSLLLRLFIPESPETWAYGGIFRWRFLGPEEDDVLFEFDDQGRVSRVTIPEDTP